jgi:hypothetical protein
MLYLQQNTCISTSKIYVWARESDSKNTIEADYILMKKLKEKSLIWIETTLEQREKVMQQMMSIVLEIEKHSF